jgi:hypothetical protein
MDVISALVVFAALAAVICARSRAAGPALLFGVVAAVLFATTPMGAGVPEATASVVGWVGDTAGQLLGAVDTSS